MPTPVRDEYLRPLIFLDSVIAYNCKSGATKPCPQNVLNRLITPDVISMSVVIDEIGASILIMSVPFCGLCGARQTPSLHGLT